MQLVQVLLFNSEAKEVLKYSTEFIVDYTVCLHEWHIDTFLNCIRLVHEQESRYWKIMDEVEEKATW